MEESNLSINMNVVNTLSDVRQRQKLQHICHGFDHFLPTYIALIARGITFCSGYISIDT